MPWSIRKRNGKYCVIKVGTRAALPGRCHDTRKMARAQQRALYASEADQQRRGQ